MNQSEEQRYLSYIAYVTLREAWDIMKTQFIVWLFLSAVSLAVGALGLWGVVEGKNWLGSTIPDWVEWWILWCGLCWFMRGQELKIPFPSMTFGWWLAFSAATFAFAWMVAVLPWWASLPLWMALFVVASALDELVARGRENFAKAQSKNTLSDVDV